MLGEENAKPNMNVLLKYLPSPRLFPPSTNNADICRIWDARSLVLDVEKFFERFSGNSFLSEQ